jgi:LysM repeat protein
VASATTLAPDPAIERYSSSRYTSTHVVKSGESLASIAKKYHMTTASLMRANGLRRPVIFPGQSLVVGKPSAPASASTKTSKSSKGVGEATAKSVSNEAGGATNPARTSSSRTTSKKTASKKTGAAKGDARS